MATGNHFGFSTTWCHVYIHAKFWNNQCMFAKWYIVHTKVHGLSSWFTYSSKIQENLCRWTWCVIHIILRIHLYGGYNNELRTQQAWALQWTYLSLSREYYLSKFQCCWFWYENAYEKCICHFACGCITTVTIIMGAIVWHDMVCIYIELCVRDIFLI
jgi:hypothetical protein